MKIEKRQEAKKKGDLITIYGKPGIGKTYFAGNLENCLILDSDGGIKSVKEDSKCSFATIESAQDMIEVLNLLLSKKGEYKNIVLDTLTSMESMFLYECSLDQRTKTPAIQDYGKIKYFLEGVVRKLKRLTAGGLDIYIICHEQLVEETQQDGSALYVLHPNLRTTTMKFLESQSDIIAYMTKSQKDKTKGERFFMLEGTDVLTAKNRNNMKFCKVEDFIKTKGE